MMQNGSQGDAGPKALNQTAMGSSHSSAAD